MAVGYVLDFEGGTTEQYDRILERMGLGGRLPEGALFHAAGQTADGLRVVDVWESDEAFQRFADDQIAPHSRAEGVAEPSITRIAEHRLNDGRDSGAEITFMQVVRMPGMDAETFDAADTEIRRGPDQWPEGCVFHITGPADGEWVVADVWTSKEVRDRFIAERVAPTMASGGSPRRPSRTCPSTTRSRARRPSGEAGPLAILAVARGCSSVG